MDKTVIVDVYSEQVTEQLKQIHKTNEILSIRIKWTELNIYFKKRPLTNGL